MKDWWINILFLVISGLSGDAAANAAGLRLGSLVRRVVEFILAGPIALILGRFCMQEFGFSIEAALFVGGSAGFAGTIAIMEFGASALMKVFTKLTQKIDEK